MERLVGRNVHLKDSSEFLCEERGGGLSELPIPNTVVDGGRDGY